MEEYFFEIKDADDEQFTEFFDIFDRDVCQGKVSLVEAVVSCRPAEEKRMKIKIQLKDNSNKRYSVSTGTNFSDYSLFSHFMYELINECQKSGLEQKMYGHKSGFQISYSIEK